MRVERTRAMKRFALFDLLKSIFRYQDLVEIYSVSAETIISDAFSYKDKEVKKNVKDIFLLMCEVKIFLTLGKVKTHNYINRQNQSTTGKL
jgi:hypothetical protein